MRLIDDIRLARFLLTLLCSKYNPALFFVYLTFKYILEVKRRNMYDFDSPIGHIPKELHKHVTLKYHNSNEHQIIISTEYFNSLYDENIFFRDDNSLWMTAKVCRGENSSFHKEYKNEMAAVKTFINKELRKGIQEIKHKSLKYAKSKPGDLTEIERIVQIVPCDKLTKNDVFVSNIEFFNLQTALGCSYMKGDDMSMRLLPIRHAKLAPSIAKKIAVQMVKSPMYLGTDLVDVLLRVYFETPKFLHDGDYFEIPLSVEYTRNLHFKYLNLAKYTKKVCFKCKILENELDSKGYFVVKGETELVQESNINSFLPRNVHCCRISRELYDDASHISELFYDSCPFGLDECMSKIRIAIEPFLIEKRASILRNELKFTLNSVFLLRGDNDSGCNLLPAILAEQVGLNFIPMNCYQLISSTAKQTESKLDALIQKVKDVAPVLVFLENFEVFITNAENEEDVRLTASFTNKINDLFLIYDKYPVIFIASCSSDTELKANISRVFLEEFNVKKTTSKERLQLLKWLIIENDIYFCNDGYEVLKNAPVCLHKKTADEDQTTLDCELCRRRKYYDEILEKILPKIDGMNYSDINSLMHLVLQESFVCQSKMSQIEPNVKLIREVDVDRAIGM